MLTTLLYGSCACHSINYTISLPPHSPNFLESRLDHCSTCRHVTGSLLHAWLITPIESVTFTLSSPSSPPQTTLTREPLEERIAKDGISNLELSAKDFLNQLYHLKETRRISTYASSPSITRVFCPECGTHIFGFPTPPSQSSDSVSKPRTEEASETIHISLGTLTDESLEAEGVKPNGHWQWEFGVPWVKRILERGDGGLIKHLGTN